MKLELGVKKITSEDISSKDEKFNIQNNTFLTYVKKTNFFNHTSIYTSFQENIENVSDFRDNYISIKAMVFDNIGRLYIGGDFNKIGNLSCNNIAMWDGKKWNTLGEGLGSQVLSLCVDKNNNLFVGGSFGGTYYGSVKSKNIIMWNSYNKKWIELDGGVDRNVSSVNKISNGYIVISGDFTTSIDSSTYLEKIAYWNGTNWINIGADFLIDKSIYASTIDKFDNIYIGGYNDLAVSVYNWKTNQWNKLIDTNSNELTQIINAIVINPITSNPIFGGSIGNFGSITNVFNVIEFDIITNTWIPLTNSDSYGLDSQCFSLFYDKINNQLLAGGVFSRLSNGITDVLQKETLKIMYVKDINKYYLLISEKINTKDTKSTKYIAIDQGQTPFMACRTNDELISFGSDTSTMVKQYLERIDNINNAINLTKQQKRKKEKKCYLKLTNKIDEIHWKTINYIISNYKYVIIGNLSMKDCSNKKTSKISKNTKRIGLMMKFSEFRKRLEYKCLINNIKIDIIDEAYTSKVCSTCGNCDYELEGKKEYVCIPCNKKRDRDFNSATNMILLKM